MQINGTNWLYGYVMSLILSQVVFACISVVDNIHVLHSIAVGM